MPGLSKVPGCKKADGFANKVMNMIDTKNIDELLSAGKWTQFLESLPIGSTDWDITDYKDLVKLRVTASGLTKTGTRSYSIKESKNRDLRIYVEVSWKKKETPIQNSAL